MELLRRFVKDFVGVSWAELRVELTNTPISSVSSMSSHSTASAKCISPLPTWWKKILAKFSIKNEKTNLCKVMHSSKLQQGRDTVEETH